jgi:hypothetical protein
MLFAMIGTIAGMLLEMGLPALRKRLYDPAIAEGCIGISLSIHPGGEPVACEPGVRPTECIGGIALLPAAEQKERAEEIMREADAVRIITEVQP